MGAKTLAEPERGIELQQDEEWIKMAAAIRESFGYEPDPSKTDDRVNTYMLMEKLHLMKPHLARRGW